MFSRPLIDVQQQVLRAAVAIAGTPFSLNYRSDRVPGRRAAYGVGVRLCDGEPPVGLKTVELEIEVAGQHFSQRFVPEPALTHTFTWDGRDAGGTVVPTPAPATVRIGYTYRASWPRPELTRWREWRAVVGAWDARSVGFGAWTLSIHHVFEPARQVLHRGDGRRHVSARLDRSGRDWLMLAGDGHRLYVFDDHYLHRRTLNPFTRADRHRFEYDTSQRLAAILDAAGSVTSIEREPRGTAVTIVAHGGQRTRLTIGADGYLETVTDPAGNACRYDYAGDGLLAGLTDAGGNRYQFGYDSGGRLLRYQAPDGGVRELAGTGPDDDRLLVLRTATGLEQTYRTELLPTGERRRSIRCCGGAEVSESTVPDGTRTVAYSSGMTAVINTPTHSPAATRSVVSTPAGLSLTVATEREQHRQLVTVNGRPRGLTYDARTRQLVYTTPAQRRISATLSRDGRPLVIEAVGLAPVRIAYDERGRVTRLSEGEGEQLRQYELTYGDDGAALTLRDPEAREFGLSQDRLGRVVRHRLPGDRTVQVSYDPNGNVTAITPPGGATHRFGYTPTNRLAVYTPPAGDGGDASIRYTHDLDGRLTYVAGPGGGQVDLRYDSAGRLSQIESSGARVTFSHDPGTGYLASASHPGGSTVRYVYDGALLVAAQWSGVVNGQIEYSYDNDLGLSALRLNGKERICYEYDPDGLCSRAGGLSLGRDESGELLTGTSMGGLATSSTFNAFGERLEYLATLDGRDLMAVRYVRDALGRIVALDEIVAGERHSYRYGYDPAGRLKEVARDEFPWLECEYDANGNRTLIHRPEATEDATYDPADRVFGHGGATFGHAETGERVSRTAAGQTTRYEYDAFGGLVAVTLPSGTRVSYVLHGRHQRVARLVDGALTQAFLYQDALRPVAEVNAEGNVVSRFAYATRLNVPDWLVKDGRTYRILTDHLGSVRLVVDIESGVIAQRMDYDPLGAVSRDTNPGFQPFGFAGGLYDRDTGLTHFGARDYDAETGRWMSRDPILFAGRDTNLYRYAFGDPVNRTDPTGCGTVATVVNHLLDLVSTILGGPSPPNPVPAPGPPPSNVPVVTGPPPEPPSPPLPYNPFLPSDPFAPPEGWPVLAPGSGIQPNIYKPTELSPGAFQALLQSIIDGATECMMFVGLNPQVVDPCNPAFGASSDACSST